MLLSSVYYDQWTQLQLDTFGDCPTDNIITQYDVGFHISHREYRRAEGQVHGLVRSPVLFNPLSPPPVSP